MRAFHALSPCLSLWLLVLPTADLWSAPPTRTRDELSVLHVLIVADTNSNIGASVGIDADHMAAALTSGVKDPKRLDLKRLDGDNATPDKILAYYKSVKDTIPADAALAFFYAGHGATKDGEHTLTMTTGNLRRQDLLDAMKATNAPLIICLTDCCSNQIKAIRGATPRDVTVSSDVSADNPVIRNLFFQARGVVDVTAATLDASMGDDIDGGYFTRSLTSCLADKPENVSDPRDNGFVTWTAFFNKVKRATAEVCADYVQKERSATPPRTPAIERQIPFAWSLGDLPLAVEAKDVFDQLMASSKKAADLKIAKRDVGRGPANVVVADAPGGPLHFNPIVFEKASAAFGVRIWATLADQDGKETGPCVCIPKYKWHANEYFYVYLESTAPIQVAFYQGFPENGAIGKTQQVLPDPTYPESFGTVLPGQPYRFPALMQMDDSQAPEFMAIVCSVVGPNTDSVINLPDPGATGLPLAAAQQKAMDKALARARDPGAKRRFLGVVPSIDMANLSVAPSPGRIDLQTTSTNPDDVAVVQFGPKNFGYSLFKLSK